MHRIFISDLHLTDVREPQYRTLAALLAAERVRADEIYILGDLCEVWIGDDDDAELARALRGLLSATAGHADVFVMHGNRDFLLGERFAAESGCRLLPDPTRLEDGTLLSHGDAFCTDDADYQRLRALFRSPAWQQDVLGRSLEERRTLARAMRAESQASNANKPENIMDVNGAQVARVMQERNARRLIHGHTHRPGEHLEPWGRRYVLGAWHRCGWLARSDGVTGPRLECFPLTARYET